MRHVMANILPLSNKIAVVPSGLNWECCCTCFGQSSILIETVQDQAEWHPLLCHKLVLVWVLQVQLYRVL